VFLKIGVLLFTISFSPFLPITWQEHGRFATAEQVGEGWDRWNLAPTFEPWSCCNHGLKSGLKPVLRYRWLGKAKKARTEKAEGPARGGRGAGKITKKPWLSPQKGFSDEHIA
jgi:hypothetical protein